MKSLLVSLLIAFCISSASARETSSYEIDEVATANTPWKIGERTLENDNCYEKLMCFSIFLGVTTDNKGVFAL